MSKTKVMIVLVLTGVLVLSVSSGAMAGKKKADGKDLFKEFCKPCHTSGSENGEVTPMTLIQDQWQTFFDEKFEETHQAVTDPNHDNKPVTETLSEEELEILEDWTIDHAADSEQPMTCG
jgi:cytochrome c5